MSYILDALRKADAQRERGAARGIHANAAPLGTGEAEPSAGTAWVWGVLALVIVLGGAMAWYLMRDKPSASASVAAMTAPATAPATPAGTASASPPPLAPAPPVAQAVQPPPAMPAVIGTPPGGRTIPPRDPTNTSQPTRRGAQPVPGMVPEVPPSVRAADAREAAMMAQAQGSRPMPAAPQSAAPQQPAANAGTAPMSAPMATPRAAPMAPPAATGAPAATGLVGGLPPDAPKLSISGGVYSTNPTQRMLIVNGQVFNEGSELAPGVTLETIQPKTAVLKFRGGNYTVGY